LATAGESRRPRRKLRRLAFYLPDGDGFTATTLTRGPWDEASQHAGPPCALLGREIDRAGKIELGRLTRITYELLRAVPIARLTVQAEVVRPGRNVELLEGTLSDADGPVIRARAWRMRTTELDLDQEPPAEPAWPGPAEGEIKDFFPVGWDEGYHSATEVRFVRGGFTEPGPALAWMRMREQLVAGQEPGPLERVLICADSGNGVSAPLDYRRWMFVNTDLSVALRRLPEGKWVGLDAVTYPERSGIGLSDTTLLDERGLIGRATQSLLVVPRT
jgi:hypothetical protein